MDDQEVLEGLEVLSSEECLRLLGAGRIGRVGVVVDGMPRVLPVNYAADGVGGVAFRTSSRSVLVEVADQAAAFEVDGYDERTKTGWSVCVHGIGREISEADDPMARRLHDLAVIPWAPGRRDRWFTIVAEEITGRRIPLAAVPGDFGWFPGVVS
jgi:nitroimidazol reductase NimA-like FMN-containing flavoprotein (pyridoxamine 5'-phosphate oxidase superfamily)